MITTKELSQQLGVTVSLVQRLCRDGVLDGYYTTFGRVLVFNQEDVEEIIELVESYRELNKVGRPKKESK